MERSLKDQAVIVGIGQTEFSKNSGRSELQLAAECVRDAIEDAGLKPTDIKASPNYSRITFSKAALTTAMEMIIFGATPEDIFFVTGITMRRLLAQMESIK